MFFAKVDLQGMVEAAFMGSGVDPEGLVEISEEDYVRVRAGGVFHIAEGSVIESPPAEVSVLQQAALKWEAIKAERDRRKASGVKVGTKWFHSDDSSRIQQMGLVMMGANIPAGLQWKTMDGGFVEMTAALAQQVFSAVAANDQAIFAAAEVHRVAMESSPSPMDYDFSADWPKTFGE